MNSELTTEQIKRIFKSKGADFYYQLQHPACAEVIFIGAAASRPTFGNLAQTEAQFLLDGPKWVEEHGVVHPILLQTYPNVAGFKYWDSISRIWSGNHNERQQFLACDAKKICFIELCRWSFSQENGETHCQPENDAPHLAFIATLMRESTKQIVLLGPSVVLDPLWANIGPFRGWTKANVDAVSPALQEKRFYSLNCVTVLYFPSNSNTRDYDWVPEKEDSVIRKILGEL